MVVRWVWAFADDTEAASIATAAIIRSSVGFFHHVLFAKIYDGYCARALAAPSLFPDHLAIAVDSGAPRTMVRMGLPRTFGGIGRSKPVRLSRRRP